MTLRLALNHQNNRKKTFFVQNPTKKKFFYTCSSCICWKSYSPYLDRQIDILNLKMTFYHQNSIKNRIFSQKPCQKDVLHFFLFCFEKIIFLHFDLGNDISTLKSTLDQQNNTINGFFRQNRMKKRYYTCS